MNLDKIYHAAYILKDAIRMTDVISAPTIDPNCNIFLKTENLQTTGSFKLRGAYYKISQLTDAEKEKGVIACSAGNHAQGVALAATKNGIHSLICLPDGAPISKVQATKNYGADICLVPGVYDDAYNQALKLKEEKGYTFIHPFDDEDVIAGQGTIGLEIINQIPNLDAVIVPVGGGGLISGIAFAIKSLNPKIKIFGVQATGAPSMLNSLKDRKIERLESVSTIADGIAVKQPGNLTFSFCSKFVDGLVAVSDDEIAASILMLMEKYKMVAEGAGAVSVAAMMFHKIPGLEGKNVCCLISGGNIDVTILSRVINRGLQMSGRTCSLTLELIDKPGQLVQVAQIIASCGGNVIAVNHERSNEGSAVNGCYLKVSIETKDNQHIEQIRKTLTSAGFKLL